MGVKRKDPIGETYNHVTILSYEYTRKTISYYKCRCNLCGNEFITRKSGVISGHVKTCGCTKREKAKYINRKHGLCNDRAYWLWAKVKSRCFNPNCREYKNYGGRGITMCDEWLDPKNFVEWCYANGYDMDAPKGQCTLDRIDVDGNYEPGNCRFITNLEQQNNRRDCVFIEYNGETHTASEWSRILNIPYPSIKGAMRRGHSMQEFLQNYKPHNKKRKI